MGKRKHQVIYLRELSDADMETEILDFMDRAHKKTIYYSDLADVLRLDLPEVVRVCNGLLKRGILTTSERRK